MLQLKNFHPLYEAMAEYKIIVNDRNRYCMGRNYQGNQRWFHEENRDEIMKTNVIYMRRMHNDKKRRDLFRR